MNVLIFMLTLHFGGGTSVKVLTVDMPSRNFEFRFKEQSDDMDVITVDIDNDADELRPRHNVTVGSRHNLGA